MTTTRPIHFSVTHPTTKATLAVELVPAGAQVHMTKVRNGWATVRVVGTRLTQRVSLDSLF